MSSQAKLYHYPVRSPDRPLLPVESELPQVCFPLFRVVLFGAAAFRDAARVCVYNADLSLFSFYNLMAWYLCGTFMKQTPL